MCTVEIDAIGALGLYLLPALIKPQRLEERIAEPHVCQPARRERDHQGHMIKVRAEFSPGVRHLSREHRNFETQSPQQRREQAVEFVTKATPAPAHNLFEQSIVIKDDGLARMNTKIFKRHSAQMGQLEQA